MSADFVLVYEEGEKAPPPKHLEYRQKFLGNLAKSQLEFEEVKFITKITTTYGIIGQKYCTNKVLHFLLLVCL